MSEYFMVDGELYHYGVPGMKWGVRKKRYVTAAQAQKNASKAAEEARKKSIAESRATDSGIGSFQRANRKALNAKRKAYGESVAKDRAYNKQLKEENKAAKDLKKYNKKLKKGSALAIVGLALENQGMKKLADVAYSKSDARYESWQNKADEALKKLKGVKVSDL